MIVRRKAIKEVRVVSEDTAMNQQKGAEGRYSLAAWIMRQFPPRLGTQPPARHESEKMQGAGEWGRRAGGAEGGGNRLMTCTWIS